MMVLLNQNHCPLHGLMHVLGKFHLVPYPFCPNDMIEASKGLLPLLLLWVHTQIASTFSG